MHRTFAFDFAASPAELLVAAAVLLVVVLLLAWRRDRAPRSARVMPNEARRSAAATVVVRGPRRIT